MPCPPSGTRPRSTCPLPVPMRCFRRFSAIPQASCRSLAYVLTRRQDAARPSTSWREPPSRPIAAARACRSAYSSWVGPGATTWCWRPCIRSNGRRARKRIFPSRRSYRRAPTRKRLPKNDDAGQAARAIEIKRQYRSAARSAAPAAGTRTATLHAGTCAAEYRLRLHRQQALALQLLAGKLARTAHGFGLFAGLLLGGLFIVTAEFHLAENTLALHLLLQRLEGLIDIVIANENLHAASSFH